MGQGRDIEIDMPAEDTSVGINRALPSLVDALSYYLDLEKEANGDTKTTMATRNSPSPCSDLTGPRIYASISGQNRGTLGL